MGCDNLTRDIMSHSQDNFLSVNSARIFVYKAPEIKQVRLN